MNLLSKLLKNVPSDMFKLPMNEFKALDSYYADGHTYQIFKHNDSRIQIVVDVDTNIIVDMKVGMFRYY